LASSPSFSYFPEDILSKSYDLIPSESEKKRPRQLKAIHKKKGQVCANHKGRKGRYAFYLPKIKNRPKTVFYCVECYSIVHDLPEYSDAQVIDLDAILAERVPAGDNPLNVDLAKLREFTISQYVRIMAQPIKTIPINHSYENGVTLAEVIHPEYKSYIIGRRKTYVKE